MGTATVLASCPVCHGVNDDHELTCTWDPDAAEAAEIARMEARIAEIAAKLSGLASLPAPVPKRKPTKAPDLPPEEVAYIESEMEWARAHGWELPYRVAKKGTRGQPDTFTLRNDSMTRFHASLVEGARRRVEYRKHIAGKPAIVIDRKILWSQDENRRWVRA